MNAQISEPLVFCSLFRLLSPHPLIPLFLADWPREEVKLTRLTAGITNMVVKISRGDDVFLIRVYGSNTEVRPFEKTKETKLRKG